jgi:IS5 family transposase
VKASPLLRLVVLLDWKALGETLGDLGRSGYGPSGYDPIQLLKGLVLQTWHSLSDPALEEALRLRMDFMLFTGFDHRVPDETTFCRFRNLLIHQGKWEALFQEVNRQLQEAGLQVAPTKGAVLDATLIESAARPRKPTALTSIWRPKQWTVRKTKWRPLRRRGRLTCQWIQIKSDRRPGSKKAARVILATKLL